jgi:ABC-type transporter Mla subunit MlaD
MRKTKKHIKKNRFNKTFKGGEYGKIINSSEVQNPQNNDKDNKDNEGVVSLLSSAVKSGVGKVAGVVKDAALNAAGLEEKNPSDENDKQEYKPSGVFGKVTELVSRTGATVIEKVNDALESKLVKETVQEAAEKTADIVKDNLEVFNAELNDPQVKEQVVEAIENASIIGDALVESSKEPLNKFAQNVAEEIPKIGQAVVPGFVKVGTDLAASVPGIGAVIDFGKALNDGAEAFSKSVEATSNIIDSGADLINETKENFEEVKRELEKNKQLAEKISNRTNQSINEFTNPLDKFNNTTVQSGGRRKTKRRIIKNKIKSKRVRFAF